MEWRELIGERNSIRALIKNYELKNLIPVLRDLYNLPQQPERKKAQMKNFLWNARHLPGTLRWRFWIQRKRVASDIDLQRLIDPRAQVPIDPCLFSKIQNPG